MFKKIREQVIVYHEEDNSISIENVIDQKNGLIETKNYQLPALNGKRVFNETSGVMTYIFSLDMPAKLESQHLKSLRRSTALLRAFDFDKDTGVKWTQLGIFTVIVLLILFK